MVSSPTVVKVGGSLFDLDDLGPRLRSWLGTLPSREVLLVPGGGAAADVVRELDRRHQLGEETAHWLALHAVTLNAWFLASLLSPASAVVADLPTCASLWRQGKVPILDGHAFARADEGRPGCLPHSWSVTSDALAARAAVVLGAGRLILLKSVTIPPGMGWAEAGQRGYVDRSFAPVLAAQDTSTLEVVTTNLREFIASPGERRA